MIPDVNVAIKLACGNPKAGVALSVTNCGDKILIVPITTTTPMIAEIMKYFIISDLEPPIT